MLKKEQKRSIFEKCFLSYNFNQALKVPFSKRNILLQLLLIIGFLRKSLIRFCRSLQGNKVQRIC